MKKILLLLGCILFAFFAMAQNDTVINYKDNKIYIHDNEGDLKIRVVNPSVDSAEILLFEGTYGEDYSSEISINYTFSKLSRKNTIDDRINAAHGLGFGFGLLFLSNRSLSKINNNENAFLRPSIEADMNLFAVNFPLSKNNKFSFFTGFGMKIYGIFSDNNTAFDVVEGETVQVEAPGDRFYTSSGISAIYFKVPAMFEWKTPRTSNTDFFIQSGLEFGVKLFSSSSVSYRENGKMKNEEIARGRDININPVCLDLKAGIGLGNVYFYAKYGLLSLFKKDKGPDVVPLSLGIVFNVLTI